MTAITMIILMIILWISGNDILYKLNCELDKYFRSAKDEEPDCHCGLELGLNARSRGMDYIIGGTEAKLSYNRWKN